MPVPTLDASGTEFPPQLVNSENQWTPESRDFFTYGNEMVQEMQSSYSEVSTVVYSKFSKM